MHLELSRRLVHALGFEEATHLQEAFLAPVSHMLIGIQVANNTSAEECLRSTMAQGIVDQMDAFAERRCLDHHSLTAFTQALSVLVRDTSCIPGFARERASARDTLHGVMLCAPGGLHHRTFAQEDGLLLIMPAVILAVARAQSGDIPGQEDVFPAGSTLHDTQTALMFLLRMHAFLQMREKYFSKKILTAMSDEDIQKTRTVFDVAEGSLPDIDWEQSQNARRARIETLLKDNESTVTTVTRPALPK